MAFGDIGGAVTEMIVTCQTPASGGVAITRGDARQLTQAMADASENSVAIPVKVRGIAIFDYEGTAPTVDGQAGILAGATDGKVKAPATGNGVGINVKVNTSDTTVHVLL